MGNSIWVTIHKAHNNCVAHSVSFDTDDTSLGMAVGYIDGFAAGNACIKEDVSVYGLERYVLLDGNGKARFTVEVTSH